MDDKANSNELVKAQTAPKIEKKPSTVSLTVVAAKAAKEAQAKENLKKPKRVFYQPPGLTAFNAKPNMEIENLEPFLRDVRERNIVAIIHEENRNAFNSAKSHNFISMQSEWNTKKSNFFHSFEKKQSTTNQLPARKSLTKLVLPEAPNPNSRLNLLQISYVAALRKYNDAFICQEATDPVNLLNSLAFSVKYDNNPNLDNMWTTLIEMIDITPLTATTRNDKQLQDNNNNNNNHRTMYILMEQIVSKLEQRFKNQMKMSLDGNYRIKNEAQPTMYNVIISFVALKMKHASNVEEFVELHAPQNLPLWPTMYAAIRSGEYRIALRLLYEAALPNYDILRLALLDKAKHREEDLAATILTNLEIQFNNEVKKSNDIYKICCFSLLLDYQLPDELYGIFADTVENYLWLYLIQKLTKYRNNPELMIFQELQKSILKRFNYEIYENDQKIYDYYQLLLLTIQYEPAIQFLAMSDKFRVHAVHIALALNEMHMLDPNRIANHFTISEAKPLFRYNFVRLIKNYVEDFYFFDTFEALHYLFFLRNASGNSANNLFLQILSDLSIKYNNIEKIFGQFDADGIGLCTQNTGLIRYFNTVEMNTKRAALFMARQLLRHDQYENAIKLFDLAGAHDDAFEILYKILAPLIDHKPEIGAERNRLVKIAMNFYDRIEREEIKELHFKLMPTFLLMCQLIEFFDYYHAEKYMHALDLMTTINILPWIMEDVDHCLQKIKLQRSEIRRKILRRFLPVCRKVINWRLELPKELIKTPEEPLILMEKLQAIDKLSTRMHSEIAADVYHIL